MAETGTVKVSEQKSVVAPSGGALRHGDKIKEKMSPLVGKAAAAMTGLAHMFLPLAIDSTAGIVGGAACVLVGHPLDTAKVLMQAQSSTSRNFGTTTLGCLIQVLKTRGIVKGWYAGGAAALAGNAAENALLFMSYNQIKSGVDGVCSRTKMTTDQLSFVSGAAAGGLASIVASMALCPIELIKVRVQTGDASSSMMQCATNIMRNEGGVRALFKGFGATIAREVPGNIAFFGTYETCLTLFRRNNIFKSEDARVLTAGGLGGVGFWLVALPADAVKTQQQAFRVSPSFNKAAADIFRTEGVRGFYRGLIPVLVRAFPSNAALFWGVSKTQNILYSAAGMR